MWSESDGEMHEESIGRSSAGSEVVMIDDRMISAASRTARTPNISNLNVTKSSRVHVGPKFVSVTQNVHNSEVVKGQILGLELISPKNSSRLRCSVAVFVCWAFVVFSALAIYLLYYALSKQGIRLDIGIKEDWYLRRGDWQALKAYNVKFLNLPVPNVIIGHSAGDSCTVKFKCVEKVLGIQKAHLARDWDDIGPNFLVGGDGFIFEGRGANVYPAMVISENYRSISIMFLGDFSKAMPMQSQFDHLNVLLEELVKVLVLKPDYSLFGHCQLNTHTISPELPFPQYIWSLAKNSTKAERLSCGVAVIGLIACIILILVFTLFNSTGPEEIIDIAPHDWNITREMWLAKNATYNETLNDFKPLRLVIVQHTVSSQCHRFKTCAAELRNMQAWFFKEYDYDIPYNFLIGNDGRVYEGRGWSIIGAHTYSYNRCSIGIGFFGDYREEMDGHAVVSELQINRTKMLLEEALGLGNLHPDYYLVGAKDLKSTESPGSNLYNAIRQFPHYDNASHYRGMSCDQIHALYNIKL